MGVGACIRFDYGDETLAEYCIFVGLVRIKPDEISQLVCKRDVCCLTFFVGRTLKFYVANIEMHADKNTKWDQNMD